MLDATAGPYADMVYTFLELEGCAGLLSAAGFLVEDSERLDLWLKNQTQHHSWWIFWTRREG